MARKRGFFAEIQHQNQVAARQAEQRQRAAAAAQRRVVAAQRAEQLLIAASIKASEADRKRMEREVAAAHAASMLAQIEEQNAELTAIYEELDTLLQSTLSVDDYVDLAALKRDFEQPEFEHSDLEAPVPRPIAIVPSPEPTPQPPAKATGLFGRKKKTEDAQALADAEFQAAHTRWRSEMESLPGRQAKLDADYQKLEASRVTQLEKERERYTQESADQKSEVAEHNASVDKFIADLGYGAEGAVQEYVGIVLANSLYPEHFEVEHEADFEPSTAELKVRAIVPGPGKIPAIKSFKYTKATDQISTVALTQKDAKGRYANAVNQVALRTLHEIFEADRRGIIQSISLEVGTETISPATGKSVYIPFVLVGASRDSFMTIDLGNVVPAATLGHLGASVSKSPFDLTPVATTGIRRS